MDLKISLIVKKFDLNLKEILILKNVRLNQNHKFKMVKTTFVTAFYNLHESHFEVFRSIETIVSNFKKIASSGIPICLYLSKDFSHVQPELSEFENVKIMNGTGETFQTLFDLQVAKISNETPCTLPSNRHIKKDTKNYMILMNSKIEFVHDAMEQNPFDTEQFAWIDFGIMYITKDEEKVLNHLKIISHTELNSDLLFPVCWNLDTSRANLPFIFEKIHWRFCGGFFIGKKEALKDFYNRSMTLLRKIITERNCLLWEVNFWALLELIDDWKPTVYYADHNDSMLLPELK